MTIERRLHGFNLSAKLQGGCLRQLRFHALHDFQHVGADAAQIAFVRVGINIEYRLNVIVIHDFRGSATLQPREVVKQLRGRGSGARISIIRAGRTGAGADAIVGLRGDAVAAGACARGVVSWL